MRNLTNFRKKVALLMIEGMGEINLNASSPYLPSNSRSLQSIFESYKKFSLATKDSTISNHLLESDTQSLINTALSSKRAISPLASFQKNKNILINNFKKAIDDSKRHNSSIHLLVIYSKNKKLFDTSIWEQIKNEIKDTKECKVYLHLFVDQNISKNEIKNFISDAEKFNIILSTISGIYYIISKNLKDNMMAYKALIFGNARKILSFDNIEDGDFDRLLPHVIMKRGKANATICDFDVIVYLNNFCELSFEILYLINKRTKSFIGDKNIFDIKNYTLTRANFRLSGKKVNYLLDSSLNKKNILTLFSEYGLNQVLITKKEYREMMIGALGSDEVLEGQDLALIESGEHNQRCTEYILKTFEKEIYSDKHDFVYAHISDLRAASQENNFKKAIEVIDEIDKNIDEIIEISEDKKYTLIITSPFSGAESFAKQIYRNQFNPDNVKLGKVPLALINKSYKKKERSRLSVKSSGIMDMIYSKHTIFDLAPTILDLFNLEFDEQFEGRSLINEG